MVIYIDLIIILNILIDFVLLFFTNLLLKRNISFYKLLIGALIGGLSTLLLFKINNNIELTLYKLIISIIMVLITFKYESFNYFKDNIIWLYILSIILGGTLYLIKDSLTLSNNNLLFLNNDLTINIYLILLLIPFILYKYLKKQNKYQINYSNYYNISIEYESSILKGTAFLDTGNTLKDPITGKPIMLVNKELIKTNLNTFLVPYSVVNDKGLMEVFKPNKVYINKKQTKKCLIGLCDVNLNGVKIILNKEIL